MPTIRNIDTIKATLLRPSLTSHFEVEIGLPSSSLGQSLRTFLGVNQDKLNLMCSDAVLPGSQLATTEINNDFTGVTERHAYRRIYDETIDLSFYVDAGNYLPIKFFEEWISGIVNEDQREARAGEYNYRVRYPNDYVAQGLKVIKFERDMQSKLEYEFVRSYPRSITSMPVSYDGSSLLKCSVQMTYVRYVVSSVSGMASGPYNPFQQSQFNLKSLIGNLVDDAVDNITGNDFLGDAAGTLVTGGAINVGPIQVNAPGLLR
tara:strand:+ start:690 stop:1475 length:786 start_codon:yes stop_codon:yes gene_type:complete